VWPESVERIAIFLRGAGAEGRLEEVLPGAEHPPGLRLRTAAFESGDGLVVALLPAGRELDREKLGRAASAGPLREVETPEFPFAGARVVLDRLALTSPEVWLEAGSSRHLLGLPPAGLVRLVRAQVADLVDEGRNGGG
jgi:prolyl-tRNA editing enzyme YbaK/EbsC (Cys-tRNA(Pro) deacylase)